VLDTAAVTDMNNIDHVNRDRPARRRNAHQDTRVPTDNALSRGDLLTLAQLFMNLYTQVAQRGPQNVLESVPQALRPVGRARWRGMIDEAGVHDFIERAATPLLDDFFVEPPYDAPHRYRYEPGVVLSAQPHSGSGTGRDFHHGFARKKARCQRRETNAETAGI